MNAQKFTQKSLEAIQEANNLALSNNNMQIEQRYIRGLFPEVTPHYQVGQGRFIRNFSLLKEGSKNSEIGTAIAAYIQMIDRALKGCLGADSGEWDSIIEKIYLSYLKETPIIC